MLMPDVAVVYDPAHDCVVDVPYLLDVDFGQDDRVPCVIGQIRSFGSAPDSEQASSPRNGLSLRSRLFFDTWLSLARLSISSPKASFCAWRTQKRSASAASAAVTVPFGLPLSTLRTL